MTIYQTRPNPLLTRVLAETGLRWVERRSAGALTGWGTYAPELAAYLRDFGHQAQDKGVPSEVFGMTAETIWAFLECFIAGDGHARQRARGYWEFTAFTTSQGLADDLQALALRAGLHARITRRKPCDRLIQHRDGGSHWAHSQGGYVLAFKQTERGHLYGRRWSQRPYRGDVYCVTVPNGTVYVRRNGIAHWNGNSPCCIWAQTTPMGWLNVLGCVQGENMGIEELIEQEVLPWQARFGMMPATSRVDSFGKVARSGYSFRDIGDAAARIREQTSTRRSAAWTLERMLRTSFEAAPVDWTSRRNAVKGVLNKMVSGRPLSMFDPFECKPLIKALRGGWRFAKGKDGKVSRLPIKDRHSHSGDAYAYLLAVLFPSYVSVTPAMPRETKLVLPPARGFLGR